MIAENERRINCVKIKFNFPNEANSKQCEMLVNPYYPLFNYKRQLEAQSKIDLYGKRLIFKYTHYDSESFKIEYVQDITKKATVDLRSGLELQVYFQEAGG